MQVSFARTPWWRKFRPLAGDSSAPIALMTAAFLIGIAARLALLRHTTADTPIYEVPWLNFARTHGWGSLAFNFTNYTPLYSYLLIVFSKMLGGVEPLTVVKIISVTFEFGTAGLLYALVRSVEGQKWQGAAAFASVWIAPTVIYNGAAWGESDAIWAFFDVLAILLFVRGGNGGIPFAVSVSMKLQGVFLGPFALAMALRRRSVVSLFAALPMVYLLFAAPVIVASHHVKTVLLVYLQQGKTFHRLSMNAASIWAFLQHFISYKIGVRLGLVLASVGGAWLTIFMCKNKRTDSLFPLLSAACSLILMPYLLPKMHDRYFYAFEVTVIALACLRKRFIAPAVAAQVSGVLAYLDFDIGFTKGLVPAALINGAILAFLIFEMVCSQSTKAAET